MGARLRHDLLRCTQFQEERAHLGHVGRNCPVQARVRAVLGNICLGFIRPAHTPLCDDHRVSGAGIDVDDVEMAGGCSFGFQGIHRFVTSALGGSNDIEGTARNTGRSTFTYHEPGSRNPGSPARPGERLPGKRGSAERPSQKQMGKWRQILFGAEEEEKRLERNATAIR